MTFKTKILVYLVLTAFGSPFLAVGAFSLSQAARKLQVDQRAVGTVTGNVYSTTNSDGVETGAYYPTVKFTDSFGAATTFTDGIGSLPADYETGALVEVVFEPNEPQRARIYSWKRFWLAPCIFIFAGALPVVVAAIIVRRLNF